MAILPIHEFKTLATNSQKPCVSLYMPMEKAGPTVRQNPIRFKNLIRQAEERLDTMGMRRTEAVDFLQPATELDTNDFWEHQEDGLAIFISPQMFFYYRLPLKFPELAVVSDRFHLKPLLQLMNEDGKFYLLAMSQKDIKFFQGNAHSLNQITVKNMPKNIDEALIDEHKDIQRGVQHRISIPSGGGFQHPGGFHGEGSPDRDKHQEDILEFCHIVNKRLQEEIGGNNIPLLFMGVEYLFPIYQSANSYPYFVNRGIIGNFEVMKPEEIHQQAWKIVAPLFQVSEQQAMAMYHQLIGTGMASADIKEVVHGAYCQRVDTVFVAVDKQTWGQFHTDSLTVDIHPQPEPQDEDLSDFAAIHTILNGGKVYTIKSEDMPNGGTIAAIFRY